MLTRHGWLVAGGGVALLVAGRLLGLVELLALGVVAAALVAASALLVTRARLELEVGRSVHPMRMHVGSPGRVDLTVRNLRASTTPVLRLRDPVSGTRGADLLLSPLGRGERAVAAYRLPTQRRGLLEVGPLEVAVGDPFGLTRVTSAAAPKVDLTVFPRVDEIDPLPYTTGHDPQAGARRPNSLGRSGEDFYALRPYAVGDDLRRIHWPSSAHHDELLVRQHELPWQGRATVLLDVRRTAHSPASLEIAVSAAASIVTATARRHDLIRLATSGGSDSDFAPGSDHVAAIMEHLAVVPAAPDGSLRRCLEMLGRRSTGGALVVIVAAVPEEDLRAISALRGRFGSLTIVHIDRSAWHPGAAVGPAPAAPVLRVTSESPFASAWNGYVRSTARSRQPAVRAAR